MAWNQGGIALKLAAASPARCVESVSSPAQIFRTVDDERADVEELRRQLVQELQFDLGAVEAALSCMGLHSTYEVLPSVDQVIDFIMEQDQHFPVNNGGHTQYEEAIPADWDDFDSVSRSVGQSMGRHGDHSAIELLSEDIVDCILRHLSLKEMISLSATCSILHADVFSFLARTNRTVVPHRLHMNNTNLLQFLQLVGPGVEVLRTARYDVGDVLQHLIRLCSPSIRTLDIGKTVVRDEEAVQEAIRRCDRMDTLLLCQTDFNDDTLPLVPTLTHLDISQCKYVSAEGFKTLQFICGGMRRLVMSGCEVKDGSLVELQTLAEVTHLDLSKNRRLYRPTFPSAPEGTAPSLQPKADPAPLWRSLDTLLLNSCNNLRSVEIDCPALTTLNVSNNHQLETFSLTCPLLEQFVASGCRLLTHVTMDCPKLKDLNFFGGRALRDVAMLETMEQLTDVNLNGCVSVHSVKIVSPSLAWLDCTGMKVLQELVVYAEPLGEDHLFLTGCGRLRTPVWGPLNE